MKIWKRAKPRKLKQVEEIGIPETAKETATEYQIGINFKKNAIALIFNKPITGLLLTPEAANALGVKMIGKSAIFRQITETQESCRNLIETTTKREKKEAQKHSSKKQSEECQNSPERGK